MKNNVFGFICANVILFLICVVFAWLLMKVTGFRIPLLRAGIALWLLKFLSMIKISFKFKTE